MMLVFASTAFSKTVFIKAKLEGASKVFSYLPYTLRICFIFAEFVIACCQ